MNTTPPVAPMTKEAYRLYLSSTWWLDRKRRKAAAVRHKCEGCGRPGAVDIHHLSYKHLGAEPDSDLMALCRTCHSFIHMLWPKMPKDFPSSWVRAMTLHFLLYCRERSNPRRQSSKSRHAVNHRLNKLPNVAKIFLKQSKDAFLVSLGQKQPLRETG